MAMEVSCGQCQGRLLVETLGIVVACPHCGTHLSIPGPEPVPDPSPIEFASIPEPSPPQIPNPVSVPVPVPAPIALSETVFNPIFHPIVELANDDSPAQNAPPADEGLSSVHEGPEEPTNPAQVGWPSAPNLYLAPASAAVAPDLAPSQQPALFTAPLMDRDETPVPLVISTPEGKVASGPEGTGAFLAGKTVPVPAPNPDFPIHSSGQFAPVAPASEPAADTVEPALQFAAPTVAPVFTAAPAVPLAAAPLTFGAAPVAAPKASLTFGAAPAPEAAAPLTFGAAPVAAAPLTFGAVPATPSAQPTFAAIPSQFSSPQAPDVASTTVAQDVAAFAENEFESRQRFLWMLLIIVGSYASAVTLVLIYLLISGGSTLESLPDLKPQVGKNGEIAWDYNVPKNNVARGHVLSLGQSRRFGNVKVTPIKVTRGTVKFEHYSGQAEMARSPSSPVLKLWVKFENVSRDQIIAPLDSYMLFTRRSENLGQTIKANGFVATESDRTQGKAVYAIFDMPVQSEHRMIGQNLNRELPPGDSVQTFIPSEEEALDLKGDLVWRFQFRKGYSRAKLGVTTLIDVRFKSSDIKEETT